MKKNVVLRVLSALLTLTLVLGTLVMLPLTASAAAWDGSSVTAPAGEGTQASPYVIASGENLAWLSQNAASLAGAATTPLYLQLSADIDLAEKSFAPIALRAASGSDFTYRAVSLDGKGHTISNLYVVGADSAALFSYVGAGSEIKDLTLAGATVSVTANDATAAAVVGVAYAPLTLADVATDATTKVSSDYIAGGLVGHVWLESDATQKTVTLTRCLNRAAVTATTNDSKVVRVGGVIGKLNKGVCGDFTACVNEGTVTGNVLAVTQCSMGGILGRARYEEGSNAVITMTDCYNVGALASTANGGGINVGGMIGTMQVETLTLTNCYDYSKRSIASGANMGMIATGLSSSKMTFTDLFVCNPADTTTGYSALHAFPEDTITYVNASKNNPANLKGSIIQVITVRDPADATKSTSSTMYAEMAKIAQAVGTTAPAIPEGATDDLPRDYSWYTPAGGTESAPYTIANAAQWAAFSALSNGSQKDTDVEGVVDFNGKYIKLTGDVNLAGYVCEPINGAGKNSVIHLDGAGKTVSNLTQAGVAMGGLFAYLEAGSSVTNLNLKSLHITSTGSVAGFVAATGGSITFRNCKLTDSTLIGRGNSAGFVGTSANTDKEPAWIFDACVNEADIAVSLNGQGYAGGFVGYAKGVPELSITFTYCVNKGDIALNGGGNNSAVGGFVGRIEYDWDKSDSVHLIATSCYNTGSLSIAAGNDTAEVHLGGFIGWGHIGGEMLLTWVHDYSTRAKSELGKNGGLVGKCASTELIKLLAECYALNADGSEKLYAVIYDDTRSASTLSDATSTVVESLTESITFKNEASTLQAELARIDAVLATVDAVTGAYTDPYGDDYVPPVEDKDEEPSADETTDGADDAAKVTVKAEDTTTDAAEEGCASFATATFAALALTAVCGMGLVVKKKED